MTGWLWAIFAVVAAGGQTLRNVMQKELITTLGTVGATHVRFLYGFPFALIFLAGILHYTGEPFPPLNPGMLAWALVGASTQILATAMLLTAMRDKSFVLITALNKIEPVHVALFGLVFLGDRLTPALASAIGIATLGVVVMSWPRRTEAAPKPSAPMLALASGAPALTFDAARGQWRGTIVVEGRPMEFWLAPEAAADAAPESGVGWRPILLGVVAGALFGASAVGYRGGILALGAPNFMVGAAATLVTGLVMQVVALTLYLLVFDRATIVALLRAWRPSIVAGFMGAFASLMWFLAFSLESAAKIRTLALIEIFFAGLVSKSLFKQSLASREGLGILLIVAGVVILLNL